MASLAGRPRFSARASPWFWNMIAESSSAASRTWPSFPLTVVTAPAALVSAPPALRTIATLLARSSS
jgi:hypothetical protein